MVRLSLIILGLVLVFMVLAWILTSGNQIQFDHEMERSKELQRKLLDKG